MTLLRLLAAAASAAQPLTFDAVYRAALRSAEPLAAAAATRQRSADAEAARGALLPAVEVTAAGRDWAAADPGFPSAIVSRPGRQAEAQVRGSQTLFAGGARWGSYRAARAQARAAAHSARAEAHRALHEAGTTGYGLLEAREGVRRARAELDRRLAHQADAKKRLSAGTLPRQAVARVEAEAEAARSELLDAERAAAEALARLERLTGLDAAELAEPPALEVPGDGEPAAAPEASPSVRAADAGREAARESARAASGRLWPEVSAGAFYRRLGEEPRTLLFIRDEAAGLLEARWPLFAGGSRRAEAKAARAAEEAAAQRARSAREERTLSARVARARLRAWEAAIAAETSRLSSAETAHGEASQRFAAGMGTATELVDAAAALRDGETGLRRARFARERAALDLHLALGTIEDAVLPRLPQAP